MPIKSGQNSLEALGPVGVSWCTKPEPLETTMAEQFGGRSSGGLSAQHCETMHENFREKLICLWFHKLWKFPKIKKCHFHKGILISKAQEFLGKAKVWTLILMTDIYAHGLMFMHITMSLFRVSRNIKSLFFFFSWSKWIL